MNEEEAITFLLPWLKYEMNAIYYPDISAATAMADALTALTHKQWSVAIDVEYYVYCND